MNPLLVMKFGGTSVADIDCIKRVTKRIRQRREEGNSLVVVVSAMGDETDRLQELAAQIAPNPDRRELDMLLSAGERITMALTAMALNAEGVPSISFTGSQSGIITDTRHNRAKIVNVQATRIEHELLQDKVVIVAGFQGVSQMKEVTTLGRGGSDTTAVALAAALKAQRCEIYTDVAGVFQVDPRLKPGTPMISRISYDEMIELAGAGCHILDARSVIFAEKFDIPLWVGSSFENIEGTLITRDVEHFPGKVSGISLNSLESIITLIGLDNDRHAIRNILDDLSEANTPVEICFQHSLECGEINLTFIIPDADVKQTKSSIDKALAADSTHETVLWDNLARLSIIGHGIKGVPGIMVRMLRALRDVKIPVFLITTSDLRISAFVPRNMGHDGIRAIADAFETR